MYLQGKTAISGKVLISSHSYAGGSGICGPVFGPIWDARACFLLETGVKWDGKNENGTYVADGVYHCYIKMGTSEIIKKVALLRSK